MRDLRNRTMRPPSLLGGIYYVLLLWRQYWKQGFAIIFCLLAHELFRTYFALQLKRIVDSLQETGVVPNLLSIMGVLVAGFFLALTMRLRGERLNAQIGIKIFNQLRLTMFEHLQRLPHSYYTRVSSSDILARFSSNLDDVERVITVKLRDGALDLVLLLLNVPVLFYIDWRLGLVPLLNLIAMSSVVSYFIPRATQAGYLLNTTDAKLTGYLQENIRAQALIRIFGFESQMLARFQQQISIVEAAGVRALLLSTLVSLSARSIVLFSRVIAVGIGVFLVTSGSITIGDFVAFFNLLTLSNNAVDDLNRAVLPDFIAATSSIQQIEEFLAESPSLIERADVIALPRLHRQIRLQNVSFSYTNTVNQLQDINLLIPAGKTTAIVGPSGSGKSTLLSLLMRSRHVTAGTILYDGVEIGTIKRSSLQQQMGVVFQETYLFHTTIRENIRLAKPDATDAEVEAATKLAEIHDLIMQLPNRYETEVGESGSWLSEGQRQRVAIARAIVRNPTILILDEATSALDPGTELAINTTLQRLSRSRTVITVTHRLSTITHADQIVVLNEGQLVEIGTHEALLEQQGLYASLWHKQNGFEISADGRMAKVHASYLRQLPLFATLDANVLDTIANRFATQFINQGQIIVQQGDVGDHFYLIARGQVEVLVRNAQGVEQKIDTMSDGDYFGETALVQDAPRNATIRTLTDCLLLILPKQTFLTLLDELPSLRIAVDMHIMRTQQNRTRQHIDESPSPQQAEVQPELVTRALEWWRTSANPANRDRESGE